MQRVILFATALVAGLIASTPWSARAFCGFYVGGAESSLYNDATMVVMMREGTRTVLSMQNSYRGPPENFAMVVPVPVVLSEDNVRTLNADVFRRVDTLAAPRLVEYWEQDPCQRLRPMSRRARTTRRPAPQRAAGGTASSARLGVRVEAEFAVGEYDIAILSAQNSSGLDAWLRQEGYHIPANAEPALRPYVQAGTKFFVARVDVSRVTFQSGRAMLSPLRVHYDSDAFSLPVRLGLINSNGTQDLIVHILARNQRFEVANYPNAFIPTNLSVRPATRRRFGSFYAALFDKTMEYNPGAVVTEYAWQAGSCDPCPGPVMTDSDIMTLGADVVAGGAATPSRRRGRGRWGGGLAQQFTLTRLHYRYGRGGVDHDLVFRAAPPAVGGRGMPSRGGRFERRVQLNGGVNNFQGRYAILHWWPGAIQCEHPRRGIWGGPRDGSANRPQAALDLATQPRRNVRVERFLRRPSDVIRPRRRRTRRRKSAGGRPTPAAPQIRDAAIGGCSIAARSASWALPVTAGFALVGLGLIARRRLR